MERNSIICIALDDESPALMLLERFIGQYPEFQLLATFKSPVEAFRFLQDNPVDVIFTDIQMPGMTGMELAKSLTGNELLVFTTAFSEFASDAFDIDAVDYLRKPFSSDRFAKTIQKLRENRLMKELTARMDRLENTEKDYIVIRSDQQSVKVYYDEIMLIEAFQEYVKVITPQKRYITLERMKNMENLLPQDQFIRVHRSYIVNKKQVRSLSGNFLEVGDQLIPMSRDQKERVTKLIFG